MSHRPTDHDDEHDGSWDDDGWQDDDQDSDDEEPTLNCPYCRREILEDALRCPYCESYISREDSPAERHPTWIIVGAVLGLAVMLWWILQSIGRLH
jgi:DNA-directed RNA polymerase subunit RPC12/RpoP